MIKDLISQIIYLICLIQLLLCLQQLLTNLNLYWPLRQHVPMHLFFYKGSSYHLSCVAILEDAAVCTLYYHSRPYRTRCLKKYELEYQVVCILSEYFLTIVTIDWNSSSRINVSSTMSRKFFICKPVI